MEELMQELEEEKRARRKLEWELVEETEARTEQERQLKAERAHNNLLRQRYARALHKPHHQTDH
jgi:TATA-binding protein-associated factor Taf7